MKAIVITRPGGPEVLEEQERPIPEPGRNEIRIRVHASALNRADLLQRLGGYPAPVGSPADIPGLEYSGEVDALGEGAGMWRVGDHVMGIVGGGGHAEYVCLNEREAIRIPAAMSWQDSAAIPEAFLTSFDALFRQIGLSIGERLLIHAVGSGVGTASVQLAAAAGAQVIGTSRTPSKLERARQLGLTAGIDSSHPDWVERVSHLTNGQGVDAILDLIGGDYLAGSLRALAPRGRLILVGLTAGRRAELDLGVILNKRLRIVGTVLRSRPLEEKVALAREFSDRVVPLFEAATIHPVVDRVFSFSDIQTAHRLMESGTNFGKIVLVWG
jgi:NADPH:quinone reductase